MPLHTKVYFTPEKVMFTIIVVLIAATLVNTYGFFLINPVIKSYCNNTKFDYYFAPINETATPILHRYVQFSSLISPFFIVFIPLVALVVLNFSLLYYLRQNYKQVVLTGSAVRMEQWKNDEQKITLVVAMIILSFVALSTPSALIYLYAWVRKYVYDYHLQTKAISTAITVSNLLVAFSKSSNFILYNVASRKFRQNLLDSICLRQHPSSFKKT